MMGSERVKNGLDLTYEPLPYLPQLLRAFSLLKLLVSQLASQANTWQSHKSPPSPTQQIPAGKIGTDRQTDSSLSTIFNNFFLL
jgi:hypothetical protein